MGRKVIVVSDETDFIVSMKAFCESKGAQVRVFSTTEWTRQANMPGFSHSLTGDVPPLTAGSLPVEGAKILQFPMTGTMANSSERVHTINELESVAIQNAIQSLNGNLTEAAKALGIGRATLYRKVKQYNIDPSASRKKRAA